jgi:short subunit fatty acids transporter
VFDLVLQLIWTVLSSIAVFLALFATHYAKQEAHLTKEERAFQRSRFITNGRLVIAEQQYSQAAKLLWAHRGVYVHQTLFLITGLYALYAPSLPAPENLPTMQTVIIPLCLLGAQFVIVAMQVLLFLVSKEQREAREDWSAKQVDETHLQESVDAGIEIAKDTNERVVEMQERGQSDQPLEQKDRAEGVIHRHPHEDDDS